MSKDKISFHFADINRLRRLILGSCLAIFNGILTSWSVIYFFAKVNSMFIVFSETFSKILQPGG